MSPPEMTSQTPERTGEPELADELFREMANGLPLIVWVHDAAGQQVMVNDTFCEFFGVTREEMKGGAWQILMHPEDAEAYAREFFACVAERRAFHAEVRVKRADGEWRWIESWGRPRFGAASAFRGFVGTSADITERKRAEESLRQSEERYRALFESIDEGFCVLEMIFDEQGKPVDYRFVETNPAFERHTGLVAATGRTARELVPNLEARWPEVYGHVALTGEPYRFSLESEAMNRCFEVACSRVGEPELRRVALLFTDTTERARAERALRESEGRFRTLADNMSQFAWMADEKGLLFWYNQRWYEFTGTALAEVQGWGWTKVLHPDHVERVVERLRRSWETGEPWEDVFPIRAKDGAYRWFLSRALPIRDGAGNIIRWFGTHTDVTRQREAEERLRESDRRKDEYLAMLGHELRNPLAAIQSAAELVKLTKVDDPRLHRASAVLERQSAHMARLIEGLLEVSRIARGKVSLDRETVDVRSILTGVLEDRSAQIAARQLELLRALPSEPVWAFVDPVRLAQVFDNLLGNAIKFTPPRGTISVVLERDGGAAVARIRDTGLGIRPERLSQIFEPFHQEKQDAARGSDGLGLGLALAKGLIELHEGTIEARSAGLGSGAELVVRLPLARRPSARGKKPLEAAVGGRKILIVEDNVDAAQMLLELLKMRGHEAQIAQNGAAALELVSELAPALVLCDIGLPGGMSGYDFARAIRADASFNQVRLVALTGYGQPEDRKRTEQAGFDAHLTKPVTLEALEGVIVAAERASNAAGPAGVAGP